MLINAYVHLQPLWWQREQEQGRESNYVRLFPYRDDIPQLNSTLVIRDFRSSVVEKASKLERFLHTSGKTRDEAVSQLFNYVRRPALVVYHCDENSHDNYIHTINLLPPSNEIRPEVLFSVTCYYRSRPFDFQIRKESERLQEYVIAIPDIDFRHRLPPLVSILLTLTDKEKNALVETKTRAGRYLVKISDRVIATPLSITNHLSK